MSTPLTEAFKYSKFQLAGHGPRNVQVLKKAIADIPDDQVSDMYGNGEGIEDFENKMAAYLGKDSAVFFPSGTMAQQIALRIWCDQKGVHKVAYHPLSHLEIHEEDGLKELHNIETFLLADKGRVIEFEDVKEMDQDISCLLLELPQREIGGQLPSYETLVRISEYCRGNGIKLHLDGARLLEILPFYQKTAVEVCALFDSVYISFYKGIGGIAGAILAGDKEFTDTSKIWKRRHGGDLISLYPYIIPADYYFEKRRDKMEQYLEGAKELAAFFNSVPSISTTPIHPVSNMFHVHIEKRKDDIEAILAQVIKETGIGVTSYVKETEEKTCYFEVSIGDQYENIPKAQLKELFERLEIEIGIN